MRRRSSPHTFRQPTKALAPRLPARVFSCATSKAPTPGRGSRVSPPRGHLARATHVHRDRICDRGRLGCPWHVNARPVRHMFAIGMAEQQALPPKVRSAHGIQSHLRAAQPMQGQFERATGSHSEQRRRVDAEQGGIVLREGCGVGCGGRDLRMRLGRQVGLGEDDRMRGQGSQDSDAGQGLVHAIPLRVSRSCTGSRSRSQGNDGQGDLAARQSCGPGAGPVAWRLCVHRLRTGCALPA